MIQEAQNTDMLNSCTEAARSKFREAVKPIYSAKEDGTPEHIGSALLLSLTEGRFLLTAAHVIDWNNKTTLYLGHGSMIALNLDTLVTAAPNNDRDADHADFAIAKLSDEITSKLSGAKFITEGEIDFSKHPSEGRIYTCLGFPNSKNKVNTYKGNSITPVVFPYTSIGRPASQLSEIASEADHTLVDYSKKYGRDENGNRVNMVALNGCSGGAIVDCGEISLRTLSEPDSPKLIAVLIEAHSKEKVILGTRLSSILTHLRENELL